MKFEDAVAAMRQGRRVQRECWSPDVAWRFCDGYIVLGHSRERYDYHNTSITISEVNADDWRIVEPIWSGGIVHSAAFPERWIVGEGVPAPKRDEFFEDYMQRRGCELTEGVPSRKSNALADTLGDLREHVDTLAQGLCERIRRLEERVKVLEARPAPQPIYPGYTWWPAPYYERQIGGPPPRVNYLPSWYDYGTAVPCPRKTSTTIG